MSVRLRATPNFQKASKPLLKKYPSLRGELLQLERALLKEPLQGTKLGNNAFKIRLAIKSEGKGKSGGARVITHVETILVTKPPGDEEVTTVDLLTIYDKGEVDSIPDKELALLIKALKDRSDL